MKIGSAKVTVVAKKNKSKKATIKVKVMKNAVKKVSISKAKTDLVVGETVKLTTKLTPSKKVGKVIKWTSRQKSVATVSSNGTVKAIQAGTAKIQATAADGSGKSATCTITVWPAKKNQAVIEEQPAKEEQPAGEKQPSGEEQTGLVSIETLSDHAIRITLNRVTSLTADDFEVAIRTYSIGSYNKKMKVTHVYSQNTNIYDIMLDTSNGYLNAGEYVKVTVPSLPGVKTLETRIDGSGWEAPEETIITSVVGENISKRISFDQYMSGNCDYSVEGLPDGLSIKEDATEVTITGAVTTVCKNKVATIAATDELGNTVTITVRFIIGDSDTIVYYAKPINVLHGGSFDEKVISFVAGGSGSYTYTVTGNPDHTKSSNNRIYAISDTTDPDTGRPIYDIPVGSYPFNISI